MPTLRLLKPYKMLAVGDTFCPSAPIAELLIARGTAEIVLDKPKRGRPKKKEKA